MQVEANQLKLLIRPGEVADLPTLLKLQQESIAVLSQATYTPTQIQALINHQGEVRALYREAPHELLFVAEIKGKIVGFSALDFHYSLIQGLFIDPAWARKGVGKQLLAHMESLAQDRGRRWMQVMSSLTGIPFYASQGYTSTGETGFATSDQVWIPCQNMEKRLRPTPPAPAQPQPAPPHPLGLWITSLILFTGLGLMVLQAQPPQQPFPTPPAQPKGAG
jgi:GNAT superfamily N-acetyltransferase